MLNVFLSLLKLSVLNGSWSIKEVEITPATASEVFRLLMINNQNLPPEIDDIVQYLDHVSLNVMEPSKKTAILCFIIDELLSSPSLIRYAVRM